MEHSSGLTREIRSSTISEQFDLAGYSESRTKDLITSTFSTPFTDTTNMVRITLVVGGGKLVRARYDDDLIRWVTTSLRDIGFVEDKSAAETLDSQGTYKTQHDTGQNLKYVIVFPRIAMDSKTKADSSGNGNNNVGVGVDDENNISMMNKSSPEYIVTACEMSTFQDIVHDKTPSWRQKKKLLKILQESYDRFQIIEKKLISGTPLTTLEQALYDGSPGNDHEKITWLQSEIKKMVSDGQLTASEKKEVISSIQTNIQSLSSEIELAACPKRKVLEDKKADLMARKETIEKIIPIQHRLKHGADIQKLKIKLIPLLSLEDRGRSMSLTLADLKSLEEKSSIESQITELEVASRGWFEDEADFQAMVDLETNEAKVKAAKKAQQTTTSSLKSLSGGSKSATVSKPTTLTAWSTIGVAKKSGNSSSSSGSSGMKKSGFAAAFNNNNDDD